MNDRFFWVYLLAVAIVAILASLYLTGQGDEDWFSLIAPRLLPWWVLLLWEIAFLFLALLGTYWLWRLTANPFPNWLLGIALFFTLLSLLLFFQLSASPSVPNILAFLTLIWLASLAWVVSPWLALFFIPYLLWLLYFGIVTA